MGTLASPSMDSRFGIRCNRRSRGGVPRETGRAVVRGVVGVSSVGPLALGSVGPTGKVVESTISRSNISRSMASMDGMGRDIEAGAASQYRQRAATRTTTAAAVDGRDAPASAPATFHNRPPRVADRIADSAEAAHYRRRARKTRAEGAAADRRTERGGGGGGGFVGERTRASASLDVAGRSLPRTTGPGREQQVEEGRRPAASLRGSGDDRGRPPDGDRRAAARESPRLPPTPPRASAGEQRASASSSRPAAGILHNGRSRSRPPVGGAENAPSRGPSSDPSPDASQTNRVERGGPPSSSSREDEDHRSYRVSFAPALTQTQTFTLRHVPNVLFSLIEEEDWEEVRIRAEIAPHETTQWVRPSANPTGEPIRLLALHAACAKRPPPTVITALLLADTDALRYPDVNGRTLLHWAVDADEGTLPPEVVDTVVGGYPDACRVREHVYGCLPLHVACACGGGGGAGAIRRVVSAQGGVSTSVTFGRGDERAVIVRRLLKAFPEGTLCRDSQRGWIPLHAAARNGAPAALILELLNVRPESAGIADRDKRLPLHFVARYADRWDERQLCLFLGALIDACPDALKRREDKNGYTPLHTACASNHPPNLMNALLSYFLDMDRGGRAALSIPDYDQRLPLHVAAQSVQPFSVLRDLLLPNPTSAADQDKNGRIALHWAVHAGASASSVSILLRAFPDGAKVVEGKYGWTPLHMLMNARGGAADRDVVAELLAHFPEGARTRDKHGALPLHLLCKNFGGNSGGGGGPVIADMLLRAYPECLRVKDRKGRTAPDLLETSRGNDEWREAMKMVLDESGTLREV